MRPPAAPGDALLWLTAQYTRPERKYHGLSHIAALLADGAGRLSTVQTIAVWFHDAIYVPGAQDNEALSADACAAWMKLAGWPPEEITKARRIILDTQRHVPAIPESALVIDLDLWILGSPPAEYEAYRRAIRAEFAAVPDEMFKAGRAAWIEGMLARPRIYWGEGAAEKEREGVARDNLGRERAGQAESAD